MTQKHWCTLIGREQSRDLNTGLWLAESWEWSRDLDTIFYWSINDTESPVHFDRFGMITWPEYWPLICWELRVIMWLVYWPLFSCLLGPLCRKICNLSFLLRIMWAIHQTFNIRLLVSLIHYHYISL